MTRIVFRDVPETVHQLPDTLHPVLKRIYAARGISSAAELENGLDQLPSPQQMKGMDKASDRLLLALQQQQQIIVVGDFDADGATSTALLVSGLKAMGFTRVDFVLPNRFDYGYGLSPEVVELVRPMHPDLLITVDNGISSVEGVAHARALGMDVIVTDHHLPPQTLPDAAAIINPSQPGCEFPSRCIAGVGVVFFLLVALRGCLRERGWFASHAITEPNLADYLDLVALGTVADVVPLDHINRVLVSQGVRRIRAGKVRPGIRALLEVANRELSRVKASDLGFFAAPRLNAAGRLAEMHHGVCCLLSGSEIEAQALAMELDAINRERRDIEAGMQAEALQELENTALADSESLAPGLCLYRESWHQGVVGLLASRIKERYHRPVICFAQADDDTLKGSARSVPGFHIRDALDAIASQHPGMISRFGGHAMAAGLSLPQAHYAAFVAAFQQEAERQLGRDEPNRELLVDAELPIDALQTDFARQLEQAGPWGQRFPEPAFCGEFEIADVRVLAGGKYLKWQLKPLSFDRHVDGVTLEALAFAPQEHWFELQQGQRLRLVYRLDINFFNGRESLQLLVDFAEFL